MSSSITGKRKVIIPPDSVSSSPPEKRIKLSSTLETSLTQSGKPIQHTQPIPHTIPAIPVITNEWVSGSSTRNYAINDPLIDWLDKYGAARGILSDEKSPGYDQRLDFEKFLTEQGNKYEVYIMGKLREKFPAGEIIEVKFNSFIVRMRETINLMKLGTPIIYQGMIFDTESQTYGTPDLIVRSDYINRPTENKSVISTETGCGLSPNWHYRIVDIKFSTLKLKANFTTLLNQGSQRAYKTQMCIYNTCLEHIQGFNPYKAYILGRGWEAVKKNVAYYSGDPFSKLAVIDFSGDDIDIIDLTQEAVDWWRRMSIQGNSWQIHPTPSVPELYPNMSNESGSGWDNLKRALAASLGELTLVWQVGLAARQAAHDHEVYRWDDPDCTAEVLGITGPKLGPKVDQLLKVNQGTDLVVPGKISSDMYNWRDATCLEFFIDFENVTSIYNLHDNSCNLIYMLGMGWGKHDWNYKCIIADALDYKEEERIIREFLDTIDSIVYTVNCPNCRSQTRNLPNHIACDGCKCMWTWKDYRYYDDRPIKLYHYSSAESSMLTKAFDRITFDPVADKHLINIRSRLQLCDLLKLIRDEPVFIKGALDFSLKNIVAALKQQGKIQISYDGCVIKSGSDGLMAAIAAASQSTFQFRDHPLIQETVKYNSIDCQSLYEILNYFRNSL
jgi:hypothetical protein